MPVYNVEAYVEAAMRSVYHQTYPNIELVVVDDCGSDSSMEIVERVALKAPREVIVHIEHHNHNSGLSAARNTGIRVATGEFIIFFDSDDLLPKDAINDLYETISLTSAEVVSARKRRFIKDNELKESSDNMSNKILIYKTNEQIINAFYAKEIDVISPNKLYSRKHILALKLQFEPNLLHEDELWSFYLIRKLNSLVVLDKICYYHRISPKSITTNYGSKNVRSLFTIFDLIYKEMEKSGFNMKTLEWLAKSEHTAVANGVRRIPKKELISYIRHIRKTQPKVIQLRIKGPFWGRIKYYMLFHFPYPVCYYTYLWLYKK